MSTPYIILHPCTSAVKVELTTKRKVIELATLCEGCKEPLHLTISSDFATCRCGASYFINRGQP